MLIIALLKGIWKMFVLEKECSGKLLLQKKKMRGVKAELGFCNQSKVPATDGGRYKVEEPERRGEFGWCGRMKD
jgi:hypothetical protein